MCDYGNLDNGYAGGLQIADRTNTIAEAIGISLDGVLLRPKLDKYMVNKEWNGKYVDNWFPGYMSTDEEIENYKSTNLSVDIDSCLGMISANGEYYHSSASECIIGAKAITT